MKGSVPIEIARGERVIGMCPSVSVLFQSVAARYVLPPDKIVEILNSRARKNP